ncbi:hypothetical protein SDC9_56701 [bioreactor metagenome]|uniref:Uncharacterized protein n=1 Tax=bioreactor metagenome TaxID=1076179 RepID=A0A644X2J6_9ZZZZ
MEVDNQRKIEDIINVLSQVILDYIQKCESDKESLN